MEANHLAGIIEHHLRIGDTTFYVPPTAIHVHRQMKNKRAKVLRARNSLPKESGYYDKVIDITLFFPDKYAINNELRPLLAQVKKCPFLPIENTYLNDIQKVDSMTISGITVQTTPGFPHSLQATIQAYAFNHLSYIVDDDGRTFDEMINWPLFRWYYQRNLDPDEQGTFHTYYEPLFEELSNDFRFRIAASDDLDAIAAWRKEKRTKVKNYLDDLREGFWMNEQREAEFTQEYDELYDKAMYEYDIHYEDWDIPGLVLTDFSIGFENTISSFQLQEDSMPTHQYLGSQDTILVARFTTDNDECIASLENLLQRSTYLIREYHKEISNGFLAFDHSLARLFGVNNVTLEDVKTSTIPGQPGSYEVTVTMIAYNRIERKLSEVKWLTETAEWNIDKYQDQGFWSLLTSLNPVNWDFGLGTNETGIGTAVNRDQTGSDWIYDAPGLSPVARYLKFFADRPFITSAMSPLVNMMKGHQTDGINYDQNDFKQMIYDEAVKQFFRMAEVYPDLELPTYGEAALAGFDVENTNNGVFVEPDFFIDYHQGTLLWEELLAAMNQEYRTVLRDGVGGEAMVEAEKITSMNEVTQQEIAESQGMYEQAKEDATPIYDAIDESLVDKENLSTDDMEALIRLKASELGIAQHFAVAFAKTMDEELKQFYHLGINAKQNNVKATAFDQPVQLNNQLEFYNNEDGTIDGAFIGVMKVRKLNGSNVNLLGKNIEYNIETGIKKMVSYMLELETMHTTKTTENQNLYQESHVRELFSLTDNTALNQQKARFAGVVFFYLGFENEYLLLVKDNKRPSTKIIQLVQAILNEVDKPDEWSREEIQKKVKDLPIKDFKEVKPTNGAVTPNMTVEDFQHDEKIHQGMLHDMLRYDKRGRLLRAFPTFFLSLIDEGQFVGSIKLSDQFFQYQAVMDIMYTNSRKEASSTLVLEMANIYGSLDDAEKGMDLAHTSYGEVFKLMTMPGAVARNTERSRHRNSNHYKSIMLRTGTRIHFRMGYGSNPLDMPTIMNGTITSIQNNGESVTVIAQDDGIELTNKIRADVNDTTKGGFLFSKQEPTEIVDEILTDSQGFFKNLWAGLSNEEFDKHSLGIMHFGSPGMPQGWAQMGSYFGGAFNGAVVGAAAGPIGAIAGGFLGGIFGGIMGGKDARNIHEINMNIYQTTGLTNAEHDKWWNKVSDAMGIGQADEPGININLYDKSVWDVLNICASIGDDHIVAVHPFGFRNTVFSGKPYFPLHYDYVIEDSILQGTAVKPFRQFRFYDSSSSIIDNSIRATEENMRTVAVGVYMNEGEMDTTSPIFVDTNIWPEKQRTVNLDTTLNAQGVRLIENIPLVGGLLNKPFKWYFDEGVAIKMTARGLSDYVRDMYDGYLTVMGDPSVKPYDQAWMLDSYSDMVGPFDVKEVTHIMNHDVGYITLLKPDAVVINSDKRIMNLYMSTLNTVGSVMITNALRKKLHGAGFTGSLPIFNALWAATSNSFDRMKARFEASPMTEKLRDTLTGKAPKYEEAIKETKKQWKKAGSKASDVTRWSKNKMLDALDEFAEWEKPETLQKLLDASQKFGSSITDKSKLNAKSAGLIKSNAKKLRDLAKGIGGTMKYAWGGAHALAGPVGWLFWAVEWMGVKLLSATVGEFIERWLFMRQAVIISPLSKGGLEFTAGINGHKGSVVGDSPDMWQAIFTNPVSASIFAFLGVDTWKYSQDVRNESANPLSRTQPRETKEKTISTEQITQALYAAHRIMPTINPLIKPLYDLDRKAALEQLNGRLELLGARNQRSEREEEESTWEQITESIGNWFSNLWNQVTDFIGGKPGNQVCQTPDGITYSGKAVKLSSYFDVIGPKLEKEAQKQGLGAYAEILKAKTMQESGGNYMKYPDVMQASESMGQPIGFIKDVDQSIAQGVKYFGQMLNKADGDLALALQAYNFGGGFIDYVKKKNVSFSPDIAYAFAQEQVKKLGKKISRIEPGYGDCKYVERVLYYYEGDLPKAVCRIVTEEKVPSAFDAAAKKKYQSSGEGLVDLKEMSSRNFGITIVGGTSKVRSGTAESLVVMSNLYKAKTGTTFNVTSGNRPGDPHWHGTGWAVDVDTPNTMKMLNGKMRFPNGVDKENARLLVQAALDAGFRNLWFGDYDIVLAINDKYGAGTMTYDPAEHWNHLHLSYPTKIQS